MVRARYRPDARLRQRGDFDRVFAQPRRFGNPYFTLLVRENDLDHPRLGLVVSKRVDKRAVGRNRLKRLVREQFRQHSAGLGAVDVVAIAREQAQAAENRELLDSLNALFERISRQGPARKS